MDVKPSAWQMHANHDQTSLSIINHHDFSTVSYSNTLRVLGVGGSWNSWVSERSNMFHLNDPCNIIMCVYVYI